VKDHTFQSFFIPFSPEQAQLLLTFHKLNPENKEDSEEDTSSIEEQDANYDFHQDLMPILTFLGAEIEKCPDGAFVKLRFLFLASFSFYLLLNFTLSTI